MKNKLLQIIASTAFVATFFNVNTTCFFWVNQPNLPEKAKQLRQF